MLHVESASAMENTPGTRRGIPLLLVLLLVTGVGGARLHLLPRTEPAGWPAHRPNILLFTVDCLRADHLGCYGYPRPTSPGLDLLASQGVVFERCIGQSGWTSPALVSILTGLYPEVTGVRGRASVPLPELPALPAVLARAGYEVPTLTYLASLQNYWNLGYPPAGQELLHGEEDRLLADFLEQPHERPFFAWYHYRFIHQPYDPPEPWRSQFAEHPEPSDPADRAALAAVRENVLLAHGSVRFGPEARRVVIDLYDASVRRMDAFFSNVEATLQRLGLAGETIVVVTADHGEELFERGFIGHSSTNFKGSLHREIVHVPLIIRAPGRLPADQRSRSMCGQIDVAPTILELAGVPFDPDVYQGHSLVSTVFGNPPGASPVYFSSTTLKGYQTPAHEESQGLECVTRQRLKFTRQVPNGLRWVNNTVSDRSEFCPIVDPQEEQPFLDQLARHAEECQDRRTALETAAADSAVSRDAPPGPAPEVLAPRRPQLRFEDAGGMVEVSLDCATPGPYLGEYDVGTGVYHTAGVVPLPHCTSRFGPFSRSFWNKLTLWNPWRVRVARKTGQPEWGPWVEFEIAPTTP